MRKRLYIRLDDITPDMNWEKFEKVRAIFDKYRIKPIIGVVPDNRDPMLSVDNVREDFWALMRELQDRGWTIAQHGYQHTYVTKESGLLGLNPFSEFAGLAFEEQKEKLAKGQEILHKHGVCAKMFMAPGHTYDKNTLKALKELGFTSVTDGYSREPYHYQGLDFIPCTLSRPKIPAQTDTLCLHINNMKTEEFDELDRFLEQQIGIVGDVAALSERNTGSTDRIKKVEKCVKRRNLRVALEEKKNLRYREIKRWIALNPDIQSYMQRTNDIDIKHKKRKRLFGIPRVGIELIVSGIKQILRGGRR